MGTLTFTPRNLTFPLLALASLLLSGEIVNNKFSDKKVLIFCLIIFASSAVPINPIIKSSA